MQISNDENLIVYNGITYIAVDADPDNYCQNLCAFAIFKSADECPPCCSFERKDGRNVAFIQQDEN